MKEAEHFADEDKKVKERVYAKLVVRQLAS